GGARGRLGRPCRRDRAGLLELALDVDFRLGPHRDDVFGRILLGELHRAELVRSGDEGFDGAAGRGRAVPGGGRTERLQRGQDGAGSRGGPRPPAPGAPAAGARASAPVSFRRTDPMATLEIAFSVSNTPTPCSAAASKWRAPSGLSSFSSASTGRMFRMSRLLYWKTIGTCSVVSPSSERFVFRFASDSM